MSIPEFLAKQDASRRELLFAIHQMIIDTDKKVIAKIDSMMGKEMIIYKCSDIFKYGLASVKNYMSLHIMPMYGSAKIYDKYVKLLSKAKFQKGCINFKNEDEMPLDILKQLINDCAKVDMAALMAQFKNK
jgi:hypothetical protein